MIYDVKPDGTHKVLLLAGVYLTPIPIDTLYLL